MAQQPDQRHEDAHVEAGQADQMEQARGLKVMEYGVGYIGTYTEEQGLEYRRLGGRVLSRADKGLGHALLKLTSGTEGPKPEARGLRLNVNAGRRLHKGGDKAIAASLMLSQIKLPGIRGWRESANASMERDARAQREVLYGGSGIHANGAGLGTFHLYIK